MFDSIGTALSTLCAIHCLAMPFVLTLLPVIGLTFLTNHKLERGVCLGLVLLACSSLGHGCLRHRQWRVLLWLAVGVPLVLYAQLGLPEDGPRKKEAGKLEAGIMFAGGLFVAAGHWQNRKVSRSCRKGCCGKEAVDPSP